MTSTAALPAGPEFSVALLRHGRIVAAGARLLALGDVIANPIARKIPPATTAPTIVKPVLPVIIPFTTAISAKISSIIGRPKSSVPGRSSAAGSLSTRSPRSVGS